MRHHLVLRHPAARETNERDIQINRLRRVPVDCEEGQRVCCRVLDAGDIEIRYVARDLSVVALTLDCET